MNAARKKKQPDGKDRDHRQTVGSLVQLLIGFANNINAILLKKDLPKVVVLHDPRNEALAERLCEHLQDDKSVELLEAGTLRLCYDRFDNGDPNLAVVGDLDVLNDSNVHLVVLIKAGGKEKKGDTLLYTLWFLKKLCKMARGTVNVVLAHCGLLTKDRLDGPGEIATGPEMINDLLVAIGERGRLMVLDPHSEQTTTSTQEWNISAVGPIVSAMIDITGLTSHNGIGVVFPDDGAFKRFRKPVQRLLASSPVWSCNKQKDAGGILSTLQIDCTLMSHEWVLIFDDMMRSGGTLAECAKILIDHGFRADRIVVAVVHYDPVNNPCARLTAMGVRHIIVSDSSAAAVDAAVEAGVPLTVVPIAPVIAKAVVKALSPRG